MFRLSFYTLLQLSQSFPVQESINVSFPTPSSKSLSHIDVDAAWNNGVVNYEGYEVEWLRDGKGEVVSPLSSPCTPPFHMDVWSETLHQYIDWIDSLNIIPKALEYYAYLGEDR